MPEYDLIRSKRRTIQLTVSADGRLTVRAPLRAPAREIERAVSERAGWIAEKQAVALKRRAGWEAPCYAPGARLPFLGGAITLTASDGESVSGASIPVPADDGEKAKTRVLAWYRREAQRYLPERCAELSRGHGFRFARASVGMTRVRLGSCSAKGDIRLSVRLMLAPPEIVDYVILHELCHTVEMNHSPRFHALLKNTTPNAERCAAWLRDNSVRLQF